MEFHQLQAIAETAKAMGVANARAIRSLQHQQRQTPDVGRLLVKAMAAQTLAMLQRQPFEVVARAAFPEAEAARVLTVMADWRKAVTNPAQTNVAGWAAELVGSSVGALLSLAPSSAFAQITARPSVLRLDLQSGLITLPAFRSGDLGGFWIGEAGAIPVAQGQITGTQIRPHKLAALALLTREMARHSSFESVLASQMEIGLGQTLDSSFLDANPASATRPAGILNGLASLAPSTETGAAGVAADLSALAGAVQASTDLVYIARAETRIRAQLLAPGAVGLSWIDSPSAPAAGVVAVDAGSLAVAGGNVEIDASEDVTQVMENSVPVDPFATAATSSAFQMALISTRAICDCAWGLRGAGRAAFIDPVAW